MAKTDPYHTNSLEYPVVVPFNGTTTEYYPPEHRNLYHDHDDCPEGKKILAKHRKDGTGGKERCKECIKLG